MRAHTLVLCIEYRFTEYVGSMYTIAYPRCVNEIDLVIPVLRPPSSALLLPTLPHLQRRLHLSSLRRCGYSEKL